MVVVVVVVMLRGPGPGQPPDVPHQRLVVRPGTGHLLHNVGGERMKEEYGIKLCLKYLRTSRIWELKLQ